MQRRICVLPLFFLMWSLVVPPVLSTISLRNTVRFARVQLARWLRIFDENIAGREARQSSNFPFNPTGGLERRKAFKQKFGAHGENLVAAVGLGEQAFHSITASRPKPWHYGSAPPHTNHVHDLPHGHTLHGIAPSQDAVEHHSAVLQHHKLHPHPSSLQGPLDSVDHQRHKFNPHHPVPTPYQPPSVVHLHDRPPPLPHAVSNIIRVPAQAVPHVNIKYTEIVESYPPHKDHPVESYPPHSGFLHPTHIPELLPPPQQNLHNLQSIPHFGSGFTNSHHTSGGSNFEIEKQVIYELPPESSIEENNIDRKDS